MSAPILSLSSQFVSVFAFSLSRILSPWIRKFSFPLFCGREKWLAILGFGILIFSTTNPANYAHFHSQIHFDVSNSITVCNFCTNSWLLWAFKAFDILNNIPKCMCIEYLSFRLEKEHKSADLFLIVSSTFLISGRYICSKLIGAIFEFFILRGFLHLVKFFESRILHKCYVSHSF